MSTPLEIIGIVDPFGVSASQIGHLSGGGPDQPWDISLVLSHWRRPDGVLVHEALRLTKKIPNAGREAAIDALFAAAPADSIITVRIVALPDAAVSPMKVEFVDVARPANPDLELSALQSSQTSDASFIDAQIGTFVLDRGIEWFASETWWSGSRVQLIAHTGDVGAAQKIVELARPYRASPASDWSNSVKAFAARTLLSLANEWRADPDHSSALGVDDILSVIAFESIKVDAAGD